MAAAFEQANAAGNRGEVPVGAALMDDKGGILVADGNRVIEKDNPLAHAEMLVLEAAREKYGAAFLRQTALAVTLEPCPLCAAAVGAFKIQALSFAAYDQKGGAVEHGPRLFSLNLPYPDLEIFGGIREQESMEMLKNFFERLRDRPASVSA
ncbi:cmp deaminase [Lasius niger]|uniref:Cmp deaminase n=1 Tax=Lasius niger TaxID=67767 RepID=A0A0J7KLL2_LASNI|nr:cmp deaminase [Lasius niger]